MANDEEAVPLFEQDVEIKFVTLPRSLIEEETFKFNAVAVSTSARHRTCTELIVKREPDLTLAMEPATTIDCDDIAFDPSRFCQPKPAVLSAYETPAKRSRRDTPTRPPGTIFQVYNLLAISSPSPSPPFSREHSPRPPTPPIGHCEYVWPESPDYRPTYNHCSSPEMEVKYCPPISPINNEIGFSPPSPVSTTSTLNTPPPPMDSPQPPPPQAAVVHPLNDMAVYYEPISPATPSTDAGFESDSNSFQPITAVIESQHWPADSVVLPGAISPLQEVHAADDDVQCPNGADDGNNKPQ